VILENPVVLASATRTLNRVHLLLLLRKNLTALLRLLLHHPLGAPDAPTSRYSTTPLHLL
jgi:hypothetical protein